MLGRALGSTAYCIIAPMFIVGIDVGGTFTDLTAVDEGTGRVVVTKVPSRPHHEADAVLTGLAAGLMYLIVGPYGYATTLQQGVESLLGRVQRELMQISQDDQPVRDPEPARAILAEVLEQQLPKLAQAALLLA